MFGWFVDSVTSLKLILFGSNFNIRTKSKANVHIFICTPIHGYSVTCIKKIGVNALIIYAGKYLLIKNKIRLIFSLGRFKAVLSKAHLKFTLKYVLFYFDRVVKM